MDDTVLSYLALKFASHPENLATEALGFILRASPVATETFSELAREMGLKHEGALTYSVQSAIGSEGRPDLSGVDESGSPILYVEAKFWAGLTAQQPMGYIEKLHHSGGLLLFVAPANRTETLWAELMRRAKGALSLDAATDSGAGEIRRTHLGAHTMALVSWRALLQRMTVALERVGDFQRLADIRQLNGLCEKMDSTAFQPLLSEELTSTIGNRVLQFGNLASDWTDTLVSRGDADTRGLRATGGNGWFGRYLRLRGYAGLLHFSAWKWATFGDSPIWLRLNGPDWKTSPHVFKALTAAGIPFRDSAKDGCDIPIELLYGVEKEAVTAHALQQIALIIKALPPLEAKVGALPGIPPEEAVGIESNADDV